MKNCSTRDSWVGRLTAAIEEDLGPPTGRVSRTGVTPLIDPTTRVYPSPLADARDEELETLISNLEPTA